jgi:ribonuclease HI
MNCFSNRPFSAFQELPQMTNIDRIFTDGSVIGNPGPGERGAVVIQGSKRREMSGVFPWVTISEMELLGAVEALRSIPCGSRVELHSDSEVLIHEMRGFVFQWRSQGWRNRHSLPLHHRDLWTQLIDSEVQLRIVGSGSEATMDIPCNAAPTLSPIKRQELNGAA